MFEPLNHRDVGGGSSSVIASHRQRPDPAPIELLAAPRAPHADIRHHIAIFADRCVEAFRQLSARPSFTDGPTSGVRPVFHQPRGVSWRQSALAESTDDVMSLDCLWLRRSLRRRVRGSRDRSGRAGAPPRLVLRYINDVSPRSRRLQPCRGGVCRLRDPTMLPVSLGAARALRFPHRGPCSG